MKHIILGDIHSNHLALDKVIRKYDPKEYRYIFLGDYCDYREPDGNGNYIRTIQMVQYCVDICRGIALLGNHDDKLLRWFNGSKVDIREGFINTMEDIDKADLHVRRSIHEFLSTLPLSYECFINGIEYQFAHAYYPQDIDDYLMYAENDKKLARAHKEHCIWGVPRYYNEHDGTYNRVEWWNKPEYLSRIRYGQQIKVAGHYHLCKRGDKFIVMDATPDIATYLPESDKFEIFEAK